MVEIVKCSKMQAWIQRACLGAQRTQSTKSRGPKGLNLEFGAQRAQRFLVFNMGLNWVNSTFPLCFTWKSYILHWRADGRLAPGQSPSGHSACQPFSHGHSAWQTFSRGQSACQTFSRGHSACQTFSRGHSACQTFSRGHSAFWHSDYSHSAFRHPARPSLNSPHMYIRNPHIYIFNFVHIDKLIATGELYNPPQPPASTCSLVHPFVSPPPPHPKAHRPLASTSIPLYPLTLPCPALHSIHPHAPMEQPRNPMQPLAPFFGCFLVCLFVFWYACLIVRFRFICWFDCLFLWFSVFLLVCLFVSLFVCLLGCLFLLFILYVWLFDC